MERNIMTTDELSKLTPKQKRVRCATLMGWQYQDAERWNERRVVDSSGNAWRPTDPRISLVSLLPNYLVDANATLTLCDRMADEGWKSLLLNGLDKTWECTFSNPKAGGREPVMHYGCTETLPEAIVNAFLMAKG